MKRTKSILRNSNTCVTSSSKYVDHSTDYNDNTQNVRIQNKLVEPYNNHEGESNSSSDKVPLGEFNLISLRFIDDELESLFSSYANSRNDISAFKMMLIATILYYFPFSVVVLLKSPVDVRYFIVRTSFMIPIAILLILRYTSKCMTDYAQYTLFTIALCFFTCQNLESYSSGDNQGVISIAVLCIMFCSLPNAHLRFTYLAAVSCIALIQRFITTALMVGGIMPDMMLNNYPLAVYDSSVLATVGHELLISLIGVGIIGISWQAERQERREFWSRKLLSETVDNNNTLLQRMLPLQVITKLQMGQRTIADSYTSCTVLFADLENFSSIVSTQSPINVVNLLDKIFNRFDELLEYYDVYKVETVFDTYVAVCGVPDTVSDPVEHASRCAELALAMVQVGKELEVEILKNLHEWMNASDTQIAASNSNNRTLHRRSSRRKSGHRSSNEPPGNKSHLIIPQSTARQLIFAHSSVDLAKTQPIDTRTKSPQIQLQQRKLGKFRLAVRVGIHSGPVVAGVIGRKLPRYRLFGDTVNTAARMCSHGNGGRVHASSSTIELLNQSPSNKHVFSIVDQSIRQIKGKGMVLTAYIQPCDGTLIATTASIRTHANNTLSDNLPMRSANDSYTINVHSINSKRGDSIFQSHHNPKISLSNVNDSDISTTTPVTINHHRQSTMSYTGAQSTKRTVAAPSFTELLRRTAMLEEQIEQAPLGLANARLQLGSTRLTRTISQPYTPRSIATFASMIDDNSVPASPIMRSTYDQPHLAVSPQHKRSQTAIHSSTLSLPLSSKRYVNPAVSMVRELSEHTNNESMQYMSPNTNNSIRSTGAALNDTYSPQKRKLSLVPVRCANDISPTHSNYSTTDTPDSTLGVHSPIAIQLLSTSPTHITSNPNNGMASIRLASTTRSSPIHQSQTLMLHQRHRSASSYTAAVMDGSSGIDSIKVEHNNNKIDNGLQNQVVQEVDEDMESTRNSVNHNNHPQFNVMPLNIRSSSISNIRQTSDSTSDPHNDYVINIDTDDTHHNTSVNPMSLTIDVGSPVLPPPASRSASGDDYSSDNQLSLKPARHTLPIRQSISYNTLSIKNKTTKQNDHSTTPSPTSSYEAAAPAAIDTNTDTAIVMKRHTTRQKRLTRSNTSFTNAAQITAQIELSKINSSTRTSRDVSLSPSPSRHIHAVEPGTDINAVVETVRRRSIISDNDELPFQFQDPDSIRMNMFNLEFVDYTALETQYQQRERRRMITNIVKRLYVVFIIFILLNFIDLFTQLFQYSATTSEQYMSIARVIPRLTLGLIPSLITLLLPKLDQINLSLVNGLKQINFIQSLITWSVKHVTWCIALALIFSCNAMIYSDLLNEQPSLISFTWVVFLSCLSSVIFRLPFINTTVFLLVNLFSYIIVFVIVPFIQQSQHQSVSIVTSLQFPLVGVCVLGMFTTKSYIIEQHARVRFLTLLGIKKQRKDTGALLRRLLPKDCIDQLLSNKSTLTENKQASSSVLTRKTSTHDLHSMQLPGMIEDNASQPISVRSHSSQRNLVRTSSSRQLTRHSTNTQSIVAVPRYIAEYFSSVTVLQADICSFTPLCARSTPHEIIALLNKLFVLFDELTDQYGVYKVETIGDAYLAVCGAPQHNHSHAVQIADMALAARETVRGYTCPHDNSRIEMRFGIHSGAVVGGVVGTMKMPRYHVFGHTVTVAGKIESSSEPMSINVSESTRNLIIGEFDMQWMGVVNTDQHGTVLNRYELQGRSQRVIHVDNIESTRAVSRPKRLTSTRSSPKRASSKSDRQRYSNFVVNGSNLISPTTPQANSRPRIQTRLIRSGTQGDLTI